MYTFIKGKPGADGIEGGRSETHDVGVALIKRQSPKSQGSVMRA